jgi:DNA polymerase-3 subunit delta
VRSSSTDTETRPGALKTLRDIPKAIREGSVAPVYLFFGSDEYLMSELVRDTLDALLPKGNLRNFNVDVLDGSVVPVDEITTIAGTYPMGAERRVVVVRNPSFLASGGTSQTPVELLRLSAEALDTGNATRAFVLLFRALELEPVSLNAPEARSRLAAIRASVADASPELLSFLDGSPETFSDVPLPASGSSANDAERFRDWLERNAPPTTVVILVLTGALGRETKLVKNIQERGVLADVDSLKDSGASGRDTVALFIGKQLKDAKRRMDESAARLFRERTQDDLRRIVDELEKVIAYVGERETITEEDVRAAVSDGSESSVFDLTDAVGNRQLSQAFQRLQHLLRSGEPALKVLALVVRQVRLMLQAHLLRESGHLLTFAPNMPYRTFVNTVHGKWSKELVALLPDNAQLNLLKQKPYPAYLALKQAANYSKGELLRAYAVLLRADEDLKSSGSADEFVLYRAIEEIVVGERRLKTAAVVESARGHERWVS